MFNRSCEITARIISGQLKETRTGEIIYHAILTDVAVSIPSLEATVSIPSLEATFYHYLTCHTCFIRMPYEQGYLGDNLH
jgi:hypothetical protein